MCQALPGLLHDKKGCHPEQESAKLLNQQCCHAERSRRVSLVKHRNSLSGGRDEVDSLNSLKPQV